MSTSALVASGGFEGFRPDQSRMGTCTNVLAAGLRVKRVFLSHCVMLIESMLAERGSVPPSTRCSPRCRAPFRKSVSTVEGKLSPVRRILMVRSRESGTTNLGKDTLPLRRKRRTDQLRLQAVMLPPNNEGTGKRRAPLNLELRAQSQGLEAQSLLSTIPPAPARLHKSNATKS